MLDDIQDVIAAREQQQLAERRVASASHSADIDRQRQRLASAARRRHDELMRAEEVCDCIRVKVKVRVTVRQSAYCKLLPELDMTLVTGCMVVVKTIYKGFILH